MRRYVITKKYAEECFIYDGGRLIWRERPLSHFKTRRSCNAFNSKFSGKEAGNKTAQIDSSKGYVEIRLKGSLFRAHHIVWLLFNGELPEDQLDHINRDRQDNRIDNLRIACQSENMKNTGLRKDSTTGVKGVHFYKAYQKWQSKIKFEGKQIHLGYFDTIFEAAAARRSAEKMYGYMP